MSYRDRRDYEGSRKKARSSTKWSGGPWWWGGCRRRRSGVGQKMKGLRGECRRSSPKRRKRGVGVEEVSKGRERVANQGRKKRGLGLILQADTLCKE